MTFNVTNAASPNQYTELATNNQTSEQNGRLTGREVTVIVSDPEVTAVASDSLEQAHAHESSLASSCKCLAVVQLLGVAMGSTMLGVCAAVKEECPPDYETAGEVMIASPFPIFVLWLFYHRLCR